MTEPDRTARALLAERERLASVLSGMTEGYMLLDHDFRILDVNAEGLRLDHRQREALVGRNHWEAYPNTAASELGLLYRQAMSDRVPVALEHLYTWPDSRVSWFDMRAYPVAEGLAVFYRDVTARKQAEEALRAAGETAATEAAERAAILSQLAEGVVVADREGRLTFVNEAAEQLHGVSLLGVAPDAYSETYHLLTEAGEPYPTQELALVRAVLHGETVIDTRWRIQRPDGSQVLAIGTAKPILDRAGTRIGAVLTVRDDSDRHEAEEALRKSEDHLRHTVELNPQVPWTCDPAGNITSYSQRWLEMTGQAPGEPLGSGWATALHPDDIPATVAVFGASLTSGEPVDVDYRLRIAATGEYRWMRARAQPRRGESGEILRWYGVVEDVHDRKLAEAQLRELNETLEQRILSAVAEREQAEAALRQAQKMEAVGQLTGGIAHDFNNLLAVVVGSLDLLGRRLERDAAGARRHLDTAAGAARRAALLTQRLLAFSRQQPLMPTSVDANALLTGISELLHLSLSDEISLEMRFVADLWRVHADLNQLENTILNLALNARDAMPEGGRLTIETRNVPVDPAREGPVSETLVVEQVLIAVIDTGIGMSAEVMAKAFEPFFTTKPIGEGSGLGLSQVYGFVQQSGGHVQIESEIGRGTAVRIYLPRQATSTGLAENAMS